MDTLIIGGLVILTITVIAEVITHTAIPILRNLDKWDDNLD